MNIYEYFVKQYCEINGEYIIIDFDDIYDLFTSEKMINYQNNGTPIEYNGICDFNTINMANDVPQLDEIRILNTISTIFRKKIGVYHHPCPWELVGEKNIIYIDIIPALESRNPEPSRIETFESSAQKPSNPEPVLLPHRNFEPENFKTVQVSLADFL